MASLDQMTEDRLRGALQAVSRRAEPVAAYSFGSRAEGRADQWSDYDLAVFIEGAEKWDLPGLVEFCIEVQMKAGDDIELHVFPASYYRAPRRGSFAAHIMKHGVPIPLVDSTEM